jgi:hypothetical protein
MFKLITAMKKQSFIILSLILSITFTYAQGLKPNTTTKANKITFRIDQVTIHGTPTEGITVKNINNIYQSQKPKVFIDPGVLYGKIAKGTILKAFMQAFSDARLNQLLSEHGLSLSLYISPSGKILEVEFLLQKNTKVTAIELEQLEDAIKTNVYFKLKPEETKGGDFFSVSLFVKYQNVLNRIER